MTPEASPRIVLVGPMGAGKTSVAGLLGRRWGMAVRDTDHDIEAAAGKPISEIFVDDGEDHFRLLEREAVLAALATHTGVLALGGGSVLDPQIRTALAGQRVGFLHVGLSDAVARVGLGVGRPMLLGNIRSRVKKLLDERLPLYQEVATFTVETDGRSIIEVADEVARSVESAEQATTTSGRP